MFKKKRVKCCEQMMEQVLPNLIKKYRLVNGKDYLWVTDNNKIIKLPNNQWTYYKYGIYLTGYNIQVTSDTNNELGYLKIKTSHLWINPTSRIDCNGLGYDCDEGFGKGDVGFIYGKGAGHGTRGGRDENEGKIYGEASLLQEIHCGSGGGSNHPNALHAGFRGGRGGGVIQLHVKQHMVNYGMVSCNGDDGNELWSGGGSGGSIRIQLENHNKLMKFEHNLGRIEAYGGSRSRINAGGVGRIALHGKQLLCNQLQFIYPEPFYQTF